MTEQQKYTVTGSIESASLGKIEFRHYEPSVLAEVTVSGNPSNAGNRAFGSLIGYISHNKIAMTSPVLQVERVADARLGDASPQELQSVVAFVMPAESDVTDLPVPRNSEVTLREIPAHKAAAVRWSGSWKYAEVEKMGALLLEELQARGHTITGEPRWARYDPPWKPWFLRRNEVIVMLA